MEKTLHILAQGLSIILYPLWIPTYGMSLLSYMCIRHGSLLPISFWVLVISGTLLFTAILPMGQILYMKRRGIISDLYIEKREERRIPYMVTAVCYATWCYFLWRTMHLPAEIVWIAIGATTSLILVMLINRRWKISAHLSGYGGLAGGIASYCILFGRMPSVALVIVILTVALLLMYARLYLRAHTSTQVVAGFLLALICTTIPNIILAYVS